VGDEVPVRRPRDRRRGGSRPGRARHAAERRQRQRQVDADRGDRGGDRPRNGYFLRAESFFNIAELIDSGEIFSPDLSLYGDVPLHEQSHGQSFLALAANRFGAEGLYILDEPDRYLRAALEE
jgi:predicted ATPase